MKLKKIHDSLWNEVILTLLAMASVALLIYELSLETVNARWLYELDFFIACIFLADFLVGFYFSESKKKYMKQNWYLLIASIPIPATLFQSLQALRILRLLRVIRLMARIKRLATLASIVSPKGSRVIYIASLPLFTVFSGAVAFYSVEGDVNPNVENFFDAVWWAAVTVTTVGYGDIYPSTWEGRIVGIVLMFFGIAIVGTVAGMAGSYFLRHQPKAAAIDTKNN
ncbi:MAG TPA: ion transporter [Candidatus Saccharimonadales bacterium]|nr:ion transporter [Candidatus Saccharimonadales bacterium]